jgi:alkylation response protein AidB-like acyl-CoA dehydrogenase
MSQEEALLESAEKLSLAFTERSAEIEAARCIPPDVSRQMAEAGFYRMGIPRAVGGLETPPAVSSAVFETLARGDASCAWVAFIGMTAGTALSAVPEATARALVHDASTLVTGVFAPTGRGEKVDGGFRVSGRWQWGSGSQNAQWVLGGCMLTERGEPMLDASGRPRSTMAIMSASEISFIDTWHVSGLCGTGSLHYEAEDVFVPDDRVVGYVAEGTPPPTSLYAFPNFTLLALGIGAVCMGIARAAIDDLVLLATTKGRIGSRRTIAEHSVSKMKLAQAEADLRSARLLFYATLEEAWASARASGRVSLEQRRDLRLATTHAVTASVKVVGEMYDLGGGASVYASSRLQRQFRDIHVAKSHIMVAPSTLEVIGGSLFGLDVNTSML